MPQQKNSEKTRVKTCSHCYPAHCSQWHWQEHLDDFVNRIDSIFFPFKKILLKNPKFCSFLLRIILYNFFRVLLFIGIFKEVTIKKGDNCVGGHTLVVVKEASQRNIPIKVIKCLGKPTNYFSIIVKGKKKFFEALPTLDLDRVFEIDFDNKETLKKALKENNLPVPEGRAFSNQHAGLNYGRQIGFPLVVKPRHGTQSKHVVVNIQNEKDFLSALKIVKQINSEFIVERFVSGNVYRATLVDNDLIACCCREPANVIGDGEHNIAELIELKNSNPLRGEFNQRSFTLHKLIIEQAVYTLAENGLTLQSIPAKEEKIYLGKKVTLTAGADIHDKTEEVHPANKDLLQRAAKICKTPLVGLDFICQDVSLPYYEQDFAIIEANSVPYISMHHYPTTGKSRNVAAAILDYLTN